MIHSYDMVLDSRLGNTPRYYPTPPEDYKRRLPDRIRNCVAFLHCKGKESNWADYIYRATAFFVTIENKKFMPPLEHVYLVTAAHVAEQMNGNPTALLKINRVSDDGIEQAIDYGLIARWWSHPYDPYADVAVLPIDLPRSEFHYEPIPVSMFVTDKSIEDYEVGTGDEVCIVGLFTKLSGQEKNLPIVRVGNIAIFPPRNERLPINRNSKRIGGVSVDSWVYLIEARSIGSISGAPVFSMAPLVRQVPQVSGETKLGWVTRFDLLGLIMGHVPFSQDEIQIPVDEEFAADNGHINNPPRIGIAAVTPAQLILETLYQLELVAMRQKKEDKLQGKNASELDALA